VFDGVDDGATGVVIPVLVTSEPVALAVVDAVVLVASVVDELVVVLKEAESEVVSTNGVVAGALVVTTAGGVVTGAYSVVVTYAVAPGSVVTVVSVIGSARAGIIPPESAVNEIAHPDASTIAAPRPEQIRRGALIVAQLLSTLIGVAVRPNPFRLAPSPQHPAVHAGRHE
jgi:hypothetical protein